MNYEIIRSNRKTMAIIVRDGKIVVRAPYFTSRKTIDTFVGHKASWIEKRLNEHWERGIDLQETKTLLVFGKTYNIHIREESKYAWHLSDTELTLDSPASWSLSRLSRKLDHDLKAQLELYLKKRVPEMAARLHVDVPPFVIRRYKRLYGRCTHRGELAFNRYLYHESHAFIDYVILHECAHLIEFNHSPAFYKLIEDVMPDYRRIMRLRMKGSALHLDQ